MTEFTFYCPEQDLYEEVGTWLIDNLPLGSFRVEELNALGDAICHETPRFNLHVVISDEAHAVAFKLRFGDETCRQATTSQTWSAMFDVAVARRYWSKSLTDYLLPTALVTYQTLSPVNPNVSDLFAAKELPNGPARTQVGRDLLWSSVRIERGCLGGDFGPIV